MLALAFLSLLFTSYACSFLCGTLGIFLVLFRLVARVPADVVTESPHDNMAFKRERPKRIIAVRANTKKFTC